MTNDQEPSLDELIQKLDELVIWFESDDFQIDQATERYQQAKAILGEIERGIDEIEQTFTVVND